MCAGARRGTDRLRAAYREPDRRMRFLYARGFDHDVVELPSRAIVAPAFCLLPCFQDKTESFFKDFVRFRHVDRETGEFIVAIRLADTEIEPAVRNKVEGRCLFRQQNRIVPGRVHDGGAEVQGARICSELGKQIERRRYLAEPGKVMLVVNEL